MSYLFLSCTEFADNENFYKTNNLSHLTALFSKNVVYLFSQYNDMQKMIDPIFSSCIIHRMRE